MIKITFRADTGELPATDTDLFLFRVLERISAMFNCKVAAVVKKRCIENCCDVKSLNLSCNKPFDYNRNSWVCVLASTHSLYSLDWYRFRWLR